MTTRPTVNILAAPFDSSLYRQALQLRETILRRPLGLTVSDEERADDTVRHHFCAVELGRAIGTVSLKPLDETRLQLKQMAVVEAKRERRVGAQLLQHAEAWGARAGFQTMIAHARIGAEGFYLRLGYVQEGDVFEEHTIPHVRVIKRLSLEATRS